MNLYYCLRLDVYIFFLIVTGMKNTHN